MSGGWKINSSERGLAEHLSGTTRWNVEDSDGAEKVVITNSDEDSSDVGRYISEGDVHDPY